jgi:hypothetical protein
VRDWYIKRALLERAIVSVLVPIAIWFYSRRVAVILGVPCAVVLLWNVRYAIRWYVKTKRP